VVSFEDILAYSAVFLRWLGRECLPSSATCSASHREIDQPALLFGWVMSDHFVFWVTFPSSAHQLKSMLVKGHGGCRNGLMPLSFAIVQGRLGREGLTNSATWEEWFLWSHKEWSYGLSPLKQIPASFMCQQPPIILAGTEKPCSI
jgi:hypothetical protein